MIFIWGYVRKKLRPVLLFKAVQKSKRQEKICLSSYYCNTARTGMYPSKGNDFLINGMCYWGEHQVSIKNQRNSILI
jgi:hypothetical protein